ncbi:hypothetical protein LJB42_003755 [Komagataella kurtzmanii]|nr:hypothetical protein LJB42_003755 [Komagataella kurtzmanii]
MSQEIQVFIKASGNQKYELTVDPSITVEEFKGKIAEVSDIPADRQRLIYSGRALKDADTLNFYKVQSGHTIHLVKSAPKNDGGSASVANANNSTSTSTGAANNTSSAPSNIAAGQGAFNPLAGLTGARYAGMDVPMPSASMFGPDGGMGPMPDENQIAEMMESPMVQESMRNMLSDPQMVEFMIQQSPQLQQLGPYAREMLQSEQFRQMMTNPQLMRQMSSMRHMFGGAEAGAASFPAPGANPTLERNTSENNAGSATDSEANAASTNDNTNNNNSTTTNATGINPFSALLNSSNPYAAMLNQSGGNAPPLPNTGNMQLFNSLFSGGAAPPAETDTRPPEERYETQLRQLNDMGFTDFESNVAALRRAGGSVQGAVNNLLNGS